MSFYTSLSGLNAAQTDLNVTSNNIANVGTAGFKSSRAEFGDLISSSAYQAANSVVGQGTKLKSISQEFTQGSAGATTGRALDLMVSGQGFFVTKASGTGAQVSFTRDGSFSVDNNNNVVNSTGAALQVLPVDALGNVTATGIAATQSLHVPATSGSPKSTSAINMSVTFPTDADLPASRSAYQTTTTTNGTTTTTSNYAFSPTDANSYNNAASTTVYDSAGNSLPATVYYVHTQALTTNADGTKSGTSVWTAHTYVGDQEVFPVGQTKAPTLTFDNTGALVTPSGTVAYGSVSPTGASAPMTISFNYGTATKEGSYAFSPTSTQNGHTTGKLDNLTVDNNGLVSASYSDGSTIALGKTAIANFVNPDGLHQNGNTTWTQTAQSGAPEIAEANTDGAGSISSGQLEMSNVDLTAELVNLISAQRNFQANAKAIDADKQMLQSIIQVI